MGNCQNKNEMIHTAEAMSPDRKKSRTLNQGNSFAKNGKNGQSSSNICQGTQGVGTLNLEGMDKNDSKIESLGPICLSRRTTDKTNDEDQNSEKDNSSQDEDFFDLRRTVIHRQKFIKEIQTAKEQAEKLGALPLSQPNLNRKSLSTMGRLDIISETQQVQEGSQY